MTTDLGPGYTYKADEPYVLERCVVEVYYEDQTADVYHFEREAGDDYMDVKSVFEPSFDPDTTMIGKQSNLHDAALAWLQAHYTGGNA